MPSNVLTELWLWFSSITTTLAKYKTVVVIVMFAVTFGPFVLSMLLWVDNKNVWNSWNIVVLVWYLGSITRWHDMKIQISSLLSTYPVMIICLFIYCFHQVTHPSIVWITNVNFQLFLLKIMSWQLMIYECKDSKKMFHLFTLVVTADMC